MKYFISFMWSKENSQGLGDVIITNKKIKSRNELNEIEEKICKLDNYKIITIINYKEIK